MSSSSCFFLACIPFLAVVHASAASLVYVANSNAGTISTLNGQTSTVISNFYAASPPEVLAVSTDGAYLYVENISSVSVIQIASGQGLGTVDFPDDEIGSLALTPDGQSLWVSLTQSNRVAIIDLATVTVSGYVTVGTRPWGIAFNPTGTTALVANTSSNNVTVIDTALLTVVTTVATGNQTTGVAVSPNGTLAYATNLTDGTVSIIDLIGTTVLPPITVGAQPSGVAFTPDGQYAYIANGPSNDVSVISTATASVVSSIQIEPDGSYDRLIATSPDGTTAYVTNPVSGSVSVIDTSDNSVLPPISTGAGAFGVATALLPSLTFPVPINNAHCKGESGRCSPTTVNISAIFDHEMNRAYESSDNTKTCTPLKTPPKTWGIIMDFEGEVANASPAMGSYGACGDLHGYTNLQGVSYLSGYNLLSPTYLYYDGHPGYDFPFPFSADTQTGVFPAISGCVTYKMNAAGASAAPFHVMTIIPQATQPVSCTGIVSDTGFTIAHLHLSSFLASDGTVQRCVPTSTNHACGTTIPCPTCAQEGQWVSATAADPIAYVGDFAFGKWHEVGPHLHFEIDAWIDGKPVPIDPYGWNPLTPGQADPYSTLHPGIVNASLW